MLLILAVMSSEPVIATVESALMATDVKPASHSQSHEVFSASVDRGMWTEAGTTALRSAHLKDCMENAD